MSNDNSDTWHSHLHEREDDHFSTANMQAFVLEGMTYLQEIAIRDLAYMSGFKNLRGFASWMKAADLTYYDLIKVASPE